MHIADLPCHTLWLISEYLPYGSVIAMLLTSRVTRKMILDGPEIEKPSMYIIQHHCHLNVHKPIRINVMAVARARDSIAALGYLMSYDMTNGEQDMLVDVILGWCTVDTIISKLIWLSKKRVESCEFFAIPLHKLNYLISKCIENNRVDVLKVLAYDTWYYWIRLLIVYGLDDFLLSKIIKIPERFFMDAVGLRRFKIVLHMLFLYPSIETQLPSYSAREPLVPKYIRTTHVKATSSRWTATKPQLIINGHLASISVGDMAYIYHVRWLELQRRFPLWIQQPCLMKVAGEAVQVAGEVVQVAREVAHRGTEEVAETFL